jgi:hypothetical protein
MHLSKSTTIILVIVVAMVFIAIGVWVGLNLGGAKAGNASTAPSPYSAVYLSTGDVYFGKLDWFPTPHIEDAWFLQHGTDAKGNPMTGVYPFSQIAWGPMGDVYLNSKQIVFWTSLAGTSPVVQAMEAPSSTGSAQNSIAPVSVSSTSTAGFSASSTANSPQ